MRGLYLQQECLPPFELLASRPLDRFPIASSPLGLGVKYDKEEWFARRDAALSVITCNFWRKAYCPL